MIITPLLVMFMVVVFILLFLFLNTVDKRKWLTVIISLVLTPFVYFYMAYPFINIVSNYHHQKYFDAQAWTEKPALRYEMIDFTIESDTLKGKSKIEVESLLGKAEWLTWNDTKKTHDTNKWNYGLGIKPGAFTDEKTNIEITFTNNTLNKLRVYTEPIIFDEE
ncbi:MAG: hypothetical protein HKP48_09805 [Winogradskyella sp.]|uniref:hypothetical protein n=1 Tax=Winogradskyella sp. TaxID=1883156 RepID=UPI0017AA7505|nr:hypothetical protein [Winogradskyella sp.]MBT8245631.1 hypothetical protein [Winogradskyella sp.]NNK23561.1 hypothetical protein [Winogradskyella sp.]